MSSILAEVEQYLKIAASKSNIENGIVRWVDEANQTVSVSVRTGKKIKDFHLDGRVLIENADFSPPFPHLIANF